MISFKFRQLPQTHITPNIVSVSVFGNATALLTLFHIPCVFLDKETLILLERVTCPIASCPVCERKRSTILNL